MKVKNEPVLDVLTGAFNQSEGKTIDLVVNHEVLKGITPEMFKWWSPHIDDTKRYQMWCPQDHVSFKWEIPPGKDNPAGAIQQAEEKIGDYPASVLRIRYENPKDCPFTRIYQHFGWGCILGPSSKPVTLVCHECEETSEGLRLRSTFRLPAKTPEKFIQALRKHNLMEMGQLVQFLPELYKKEARPGKS
jgi:hypothetical protein